MCVYVLCVCVCVHASACVSKVFTSLVKKRWLLYMVDNHFLNTATQKAFINGVPGCSKHHLKLLSILQEASRRRKSLCICWLDLWQCAP